MPQHRITLTVQEEAALLDVTGAADVPTALNQIVTQQVAQAMALAQERRKARLTEKWERAAPDKQKDIEAMLDKD